jgi:GT2 family glycosyltransferase
VVETGERDGSVEMVRREFPSVSLVHEPSNPGFGTAANHGLEHVRAPSVLLLNGDTELRPGALDALGCYLEEHQRAAVVGPRLLHPDGTLQPSCFPYLGTARLAFEKSALGRVASRIPAVRDRFLLSLSTHTRPRTVPWVLGAALALRRDAVERAGGFDTAFFLYAEEVDLCYRLTRGGWEVHFTPDATVVHEGGASTSRRGADARVQRIAGARRFYRRHYAPWRRALLGASLQGVFLVRLARDALRRRLARDERECARLDVEVQVWRRALAREGAAAR